MPEKFENRTSWGKIIRMLLPLLLLLCGVAAWFYLQATVPVMKKAEPQPQVAIVETQKARLENVRAVVSALGTVAAAREVTLKAQVAGTVLSVHDRFMPGSFVEKGETLLVLDPDDYQVAVKKAQSGLANAKAALAIEQGSQNIAREELRVLGEITARQVGRTDLALRKPQLAQALATVASAKADLTQAKLDLGRTRIVAPFNGMIVERSADVGTYVGAQESLVSLVGTDEFWVKAAVPLDQLSSIDRDYPGGCPVRITSQAGPGTWEGHVLQTTGTLSETGRMAQVLVAVNNPLGTRKHPASFPLMIDDYVHVGITGRTLAGVVVLPRAALKDGSTVWVSAGNTLDIRKVTLAWKDEKNVYIQTGVTQDDQVIVSDLSTPVQGMALQSVESLAREPKNTGGKTMVDATATEGKDPS